MTKSDDGRSLGDKAEGHLERLEAIVDLGMEYIPENVKNPRADVDCFAWAIRTIREQSRTLNGEYLPYAEMQDEANPDYYPLVDRLKARLKVSACRECQWLPEDRNAIAWSLARIAELEAEGKRLREALAQIEERARAITPKTGDAHFIIEIADQALRAAR